jgi:disulfide bond formation protein DsbB
VGLPDFSKTTAAILGLLLGTLILKAVDQSHGFAMPDQRTSTIRKARHRRLWPLLFLPFLGLLAGMYLETIQRRLPFSLGKLDRMGLVVLGLLAGCGAMVSSASVVLAYRVSQRRFTIGAILVTIAVIAALLGWARSLLS